MYALKKSDEPLLEKVADNVSVVALWISLEEAENYKRMLNDKQSIVTPFSLELLKEIKEIEGFLGINIFFDVRT